MRPDRGVTRALLLQGPVGPFFSRFAQELRQRGTKVTKVNFHAGDGLFNRGKHSIAFRQPLDQWPQFLHELLVNRHIDGVFLFGDCRPIHRQAIEVCSQLDVPVWVFEEGYLRPNHVTLESGGVNGHSQLSRDPDFYRAASQSLPRTPTVIPVGNTFPAWAWYTAINSVSMTVFFWRYRHYRHHRGSNAWRQAACWLRSAARKIWFALRERGMLQKLSEELTGRYFLVPLQVHCDSQLEHSKYNGMEEFIEEVLTTFARSAPSDTVLVFKHHPHDRAYRDYTGLLRRLGSAHHCANRILYVHDVHLPTLLKHARGTVTMNSTVGTSSMFHKTPVKAMGTAVYDIPGLTYQGALGDFFREPGAVDWELFVAYRSWLCANVLVNGSFYRRTPGLSKLSGLGWNDNPLAPPAQTVTPEEPTSNSTRSGPQANGAKASSEVIR